MALFNIRKKSHEAEHVTAGTPVPNPPVKKAPLQAKVAIPALPPEIEPATEKRPTDFGGVSFVYENSAQFDGPQITANIAPTTPSHDVSNALSDEKTEKLERLNKALESKVESQDERIRALRDNIAYMSGQLDDAHRIMSGTRHNLAVSETTIENRDTELRKALKAVATLTEKTRRQAITTRLDATESQVLQKKVTALEGKVTTMKQHSVALSRAERINTTLITQLTAVQSEITKYKSRIDDKIKNYEDKIRRQDAQIIAMELEIDSTKVLMSETAKNVSRMRYRSSNHANDHQRLEKKLAQQTRILAENQRALTESRRINATLKRQLEKKVSTAGSNKSADSGKTAKYAKQIINLNAQIADLKIQLSQADNPMNEDDLARVQDIMLDQKRELADIRAQLAKAQSKNKARDERYESVTKALEESHARLDAQAKTNVNRQPIDIEPVQQANDHSDAPQDEDEADTAPDATETSPAPDHSIENMIMDYKLGLRPKIA